MDSLLVATGVCVLASEIRNSHCLSGNNKGRSQPRRFCSHVRPCHLSKLSFLCCHKLRDLFGSHSVFLVSIRMPKAQLNSQNGEKCRLPVCEHQDVLVQHQTALGWHQMQPLAPPCDVVLWFNLILFLKACDWTGTQPHLSQAKSLPFSSPFSNILPHLNLMKHLSSIHSNKLQEIGTFYVQRWHRTL